MKVLGLWTWNLGLRSFFFLLFSFFFLLPSSLFLSSCTSTNKIRQQNLSKIYKRSVNSLNPEFVVYHESDSVSRVYFKIKTIELLYSKKENEENFMAKVMLQFKLLESFESTIIIDSSTSYVTDICKESDCSSQAGRTEIYGDFKIKAAPAKKYLLEIITTDIYRSQFQATYISIDKSDLFNSQNFLVKYSATGLPVFGKNLDEDEQVTIHFNNFPGKMNYAHIRRFIGRYYNRDFPLAPPPFSVYDAIPFDYQADSIFALETDSNSSAVFTLPEKGFYHFLADSSVKSGLTLFHFSDNFPMLSEAAELIEPLRYLTTKNEYTNLIESKNPKDAIDKFWLGIGSTPERAKELIRQYYSRVQDANRFFTSYMEGWKTDRGMIYIVFGPPNSIYKKSETESWMYGEENNFMSVNFNFTKVANPFSDNDFILERSPIYKANYYKAVDVWRDGRVFTNN